MNYIISKEQYEALKKHWSSKTTHSASEMIAYNILRGFDAKRGFTPITNQHKLCHGQYDWQAFDSAKNRLHWSLSKSPYPETQKQKEQWFSNTFGMDYSEELTSKITEALPK